MDAGLTIVLKYKNMFCCFYFPLCIFFLPNFFKDTSACLLNMYIVFILNFTHN